MSHITGTYARALCLACGYSLSGLDTEICPECGGSLDDQDEARTFRVDRLASIDRTKRFVRIGVWAIPLVYVIACAGLTSGFMPGLVWPVVLGWGALQLHVLVSLGLGRFGLRFVEESERPLVLDLWRRVLLFLHGPWLIIPLCTGTIMLIAVIDRSDGNSPNFIFKAGMIGLIVWGLIVFCCLCVALATFFRGATRLAIRRGWSFNAWYLASTIGVLAGSCVFGLLGGAASMGVAQWFVDPGSMVMGP